MNRSKYRENKIAFPPLHNRNLPTTLVCFRPGYPCFFENFMVSSTIHLATLSCCDIRFIKTISSTNTYAIQNGASSDSSHTSPLPFEASSPSSSIDNLIYSRCANRSHSVRVGFSRSCSKQYLI